MNKYLEKIASFEKTAWDSDYDHGGEYGIAGNRSLTHNMVATNLGKISKDSNLHVSIMTPEGNEVNARKHPEKFKSTLSKIKQLAGNKTDANHSKDHTMEWHRDYSWSVGMDKNNPVLDKYMGKKNEWGSIDSRESAIHHYIHTSYNL
jgi:uncharacterized protein YcbX